MGKLGASLKVEKYQTEDAFLNLMKAEIQKSQTNMVVMGAGWYLLESDVVLSSIRIFYNTFYLSEEQPSNGRKRAKGLYEYYLLQEQRIQLDKVVTPFQRSIHLHRLKLLALLCTAGGFISTIQTLEFH